MENEENKCIINKKASEDQFMAFVQCSFRPLIILSLSHTLGYLYFSWSTLGECGILGDLEKEGKVRVGNHKRTLGSTTTMGFDCRY